eukprot:m.65723 g.65723  ORF g.65723 m.65723 type:complete len:539 (-) comp11755_c0_seq3:74-1690(-)
MFLYLGLLATFLLLINAKQHNVLYIVVDDLRTELPVYGQSYIHAPNINSLANRGVVFEHTYVQQAVCSPSRNSFMSGRRPDQTKSWNFKYDFRMTEHGAEWTTLPGYFLKHGYLTFGTGKLFHEKLPPNGDGNLSWTDIPLQFDCNASNSGAGGASTYCDPNMEKCSVNGSTFAPNPRWCTINATLDGDGAHFEDLDTLKDATKKMHYAANNTKNTGQPFFLGVGLRKPHLDWRIPKGYLDFYPARENITLPLHRMPAPTLPQVAYHDVSRSDDEEKLWEGWGFVNPWVPMRNETVQEMRQHYYAAVSFMDMIVGKLLTELESTGLTNDTLVCFHSDHGWLLGENNMFRKFHNAELTTRVPLIISVPWLPDTFGLRALGITELVDIYPTLVELAGLPTPQKEIVPLAGCSQAAIFTSKNMTYTCKNYALSQYPRCPVDKNILWKRNWCIEVESSDFGWMGYSLRTVSWRYTAWFQWDGDTLSAKIPKSKINGTDGFYEELYHYNETVQNVMDDLDVVEVSKDNQNVAQDMYEQILRLL